jgi:hypothetical protein
LITFLGIGGSLYQNIGLEKLETLLPNSTHAELLQLTTGIQSDYFQSLSSALQQLVVEQVTITIHNIFGLIMAGAALSFVTSLFLGVSCSSPIYANIF